jgi:hypothetical protein
MQIKEFDSDLDWVTLSSKAYSEDRAKFLAFSRSLQNKAMETHRGVSKEVKAAGYRGVVIGPVEFKQRAYDKHCLIVVKGEAAAEVLRLIQAAGVPYKVTRIDGQATIRYDRGYKDFPTRVAQGIRETRAEKGSSKRQVMAQFTNQDADTGITLGSRSSAVYCRLYDFAAKHLAESRYDLWRFEVEIKDVAVDKFLYEYLNAADKKRCVASMVKSRFEGFGIDLSGMGKMEPLELSGTKPPSEIETRLVYLEKTVLPFLARLAEDGAEPQMIEVMRKYGFLDASNVWQCGGLGPRRGYPQGD